MVAVLSRLKNTSQMDFMSNLSRGIICRSVQGAQRGKLGVLLRPFAHQEQGLLRHREEFSRLLVSDIPIGTDLGLLSGA